MLQTEVGSKRALFPVTGIQKFERRMPPPFAVELGFFRWEKFENVEQQVIELLLPFFQKTTQLFKGSRLDSKSTLDTVDENDTKKSSKQHCEQSEHRFKFCTFLNFFRPLKMFSEL